MDDGMIMRHIIQAKIAPYYHDQLSKNIKKTNSKIQNKIKRGQKYQGFKAEQSCTSNQFKLIPQPNRPILQLGQIELKAQITNELQQNMYHEKKLSKRLSNDPQYVGEMIHGDFVKYDMITSKFIQKIIRSNRNLNKNFKISKEEDFNIQEQIKRYCASKFYEKQLQIIKKQNRYSETFINPFHKISGFSASQKQIKLKMYQICSHIEAKKYFKAYQQETRKHCYKLSVLIPKISTTTLQDNEIMNHQVKNSIHRQIIDHMKNNSEGGFNFLPQLQNQLCSKVIAKQIKGRQIYRAQESRRLSGKNVIHLLMDKKMKGNNIMKNRNNYKVTDQNNLINHNSINKQNINRRRAQFLPNILDLDQRQKIINKINPYEKIKKSAINHQTFSQIKKEENYSRCMPYNPDSFRLNPENSNFFHKKQFKQPQKGRHQKKLSLFEEKKKELHEYMLDKAPLLNLEKNEPKINFKSYIFKEELKNQGSQIIPQAYFDEYKKFKDKTSKKKFTETQAGKKTPQSVILKISKQKFKQSSIQCPQHMKTTQEGSQMIKILNFCIQTQQKAYIRYKVNEIEIKELSVLFIKDRRKFASNKVAIVAPGTSIKLKDKYKLKALKMMQILNCLGAEVIFLQQNPYLNEKKPKQSAALLLAGFITGQNTNVCYKEYKRLNQCN